ncbi:MAG: hypothetical protein DLM72_14530 [Candidatus Nitrosopolaris wilkensis]|nr:MAG: hypothetical protein DLM72_14530 [Candidatus Nitrosopolaris wilkensis]
MSSKIHRSLVIVAAMLVILTPLLYHANAQISPSNTTIPALKTHLDSSGHLVFDNTTSAELYLLHQDIQQQQQVVKNACIFHNVTAIIMCPPPSQLSLLNKTTQP